MYRVRLLGTATKELAKLDKSVARRIIERVNWLAENLTSVHLKALTGEFEGLFKLRVGDYRVVYELIHNEQAIIVHVIGHRREIYRKGSGSSS
ncbi:MAG: type II toxin-antitoxin system RelE/ParE family toxin [Nitrospira sp.]|jgi:mRNA interferase RelE/StbE|nr:MAG: type II toxin-antitoxin system RelE/ParE family toxin [Nitrospira sp.]